MKRKTRTERKCKNVPKKKTNHQIFRKIIRSKQMLFPHKRTKKKNVNYVCQKILVSINRKTLKKIM